MSLGRPCLLLLTLCLVLAWVGSVSAGGVALPLVTIHDLTDDVTATGNGTAIVTGESVHFTLNSPFLGTFPGFHAELLSITEGGCISSSCPVSDTLNILPDGINILFQSDPESPLGNVDCPLATCVAETGGLQDVTVFFLIRMCRGRRAPG